MGELEKGIYVYAYARRHALISKTSWLEDVAGKQMAALTQRLSADLLTKVKHSYPEITIDHLAQDLLMEFETNPEVDR